MPIEPPQLDDLRFDRTVEELERRIPVYTDEWTDFNDSDPGKTLIQLFAFLAEQIGYRLNRIPEKNHFELLKLLGIRLEPARAARTHLALLLSDPATLTGYTLARGARAKAKIGSPPPTFETEADVDVVPAEPSVVITTKHPSLWDPLASAVGPRDALPAPPPEVPSADTEWLTVSWDGKAPKLKDMPLEPVPLVRRTTHRYLWVGLNFNRAADAGFRGARVGLTVQFDDDEQPSVAAAARCETPHVAEPAPAPIDWLWYWDEEANALRPVPGRIDDSTAHLTRSGRLRFTVPFGIGAIPDAQWKNLRDASTVSALDACLVLGQSLERHFAGLSATSILDVANYQTALTKAVSDTRRQAADVQPPIAHPLDPQLRAPDRVKGWVRIDLGAARVGQPSPRLRMLTFNAVPAINATTVTSELLGVADGRQGQRYALANRNVLPGTLELAIQEDPDETVPLVTWRAVESLDLFGAFDNVFELDPEAGVVQFGDGLGDRGRRGGRIPPLVPRGGRVISLRYQHGGGKAGELGVGVITSLETGATGVASVVNFVAATGGRDAETLDEAKIRARKELSTRSRAVTAADFDWIARRTPKVRVARVTVVPLRRPLPPGAAATAATSARCGPPLPAGAAGLDTITAHGAVSVVVVPDEPGQEPLPTPSFLRAVCDHLDAYRLVTTEVYVVPPQYLRLCNVRVSVKARPGYTRARLQELVDQRLAGYLHVLRGGEDGKGFPFGGQVHVADLMAQVLRTEGVERVESLAADFTRTKSNAVPRQGALVLCPTTADEFDRVALAPEEAVSLDPSAFTLSTVA